MTSDKRVLVIIPAYNEGETIGKVIAEVRAELPAYDVLVVDDGSTDDTAEVARAAGATVTVLPYNLGVGGARRLGYLYALRHQYDIAVQVDADGQHDPRNVSALVAALDEADLVIGARFAGEGSYSARGPRWWAMSLLSFVLSKMAGTKLTDTTSGFRACGRPLIAGYARWLPVEYLGDTIDTAVWAIRHGYTVRQVPVAMRARMAGTPSASPVKAAVYLFRSMITLLLALVRK
ncbi:glycosyltransferase family 2 protein [Planosporangium flavigriseum]|uniref:Glycosyl transferase family 2 n=1 Tax=Planosporangium flavigriseum TaxID=373681 RepID=A0A8J3LQW8_9ACTN|nr:glycosyltransferase family 2 protein [Planosporangium flavigriseum]NJC64457.1 glycosyltransferase family 2 protein [Planosporangium flavigriseum]GIG72066.1 glycosyl transferase family 2 [Planosporangium flavigriseum]